jgi:hypothetical protein
MPSWTAIANRALGALSEKRITDWQSTTEKGAIEFRNVKDAVVAEVLSSHPWNCALRRITIAADTDAPAWGFATQYTLPAGTLRVWKLSYDHHGDIEWKVLNGKVHADAGATLYVETINLITDPMDLPPHVAKAISATAAEAMAMVMTGSSSQREAMAAWAENTLSDARFLDGQEGKPDGVEASTFEEERF